MKKKIFNLRKFCYPQFTVLSNLQILFIHDRYLSRFLKIFNKYILNYFIWFHIDYFAIRICRANIFLFYPFYHLYKMFANTLFKYFSKFKKKKFRVSQKFNFFLPNSSVRHFKLFTFSPRIVYCHPLLTILAMIASCQGSTNRKLSFKKILPRDFVAFPSHGHVGAKLFSNLVSNLRRFPWHRSQGRS